MKIIDIHSHLLFGVDDGARSLEESAAMLDEAAKQGIEAMILTPHFRGGMFPYPKGRIREHFERLLPEAQKRGIRIYLGCEYHVDSSMVEHLKNGRCSTMADSEYVLAEFSYGSDIADITEQVRLLLCCGYIPVIAHVERYDCILKHPEGAAHLRKMGAMVQINAGAVLGQEGYQARRCCKRLLKNGWADVVASDCHNTDRRNNRLGECYQHIAKKYGEDYAGKLFWDNPAKLIPDKS